MKRHERGSPEAWAREFQVWRRSDPARDLARQVAAVRGRGAPAGGGQPQFMSVPGVSALVFERLPIDWPGATRPPLLDLDEAFERAALGDAAASNALGEGIALLLHGVAHLAGGEQSPRDGSRRLLLAAFGRSPAHDALRGFVAGRAHETLPWSAAAGRRLPVMPDDFAVPSGGVDPNVLDRLERWGALATYLEALRRAGRSFREESQFAAETVARVDGIVRVSPHRVCAGQVVVITGNAFRTPSANAKTPARVALYVPKEGGGCLQVPHDRIDYWDDGRIEFRAPDGMGRGCLGFLDFPEPMTAVGSERADLVVAAGIVQTVFGRQGDALGVMLGQHLVDIATVATGRTAALPCPPCLPAGPDGVPLNGVFGGPAIVEYFTINGSPSDADIQPAGQVTFSWSVEGAAAVDITHRLVRIGSDPSDRPIPPERLRDADPNFPFDALEAAVPQIGAVSAAGASGPHSIEWDLADDWDVEFTLRATSPCAAGETATRSVKLQMREVAPAIVGYADLHAHLMNQWSFGQVGFWGDVGAPPRNPADFDDAEPDLAADQREAKSLRSSAEADGFARLYQVMEFGGFQGLDVGIAGGGHPDYLTWPRHRDLGYQLCYIEWLKRAYLGGLRLVNCLVSNSAFAADAFYRTMTLIGTARPLRPQSEWEEFFSDRATIVRFVDAVKGMVEWVKTHDGNWMEIALTADDAERIAKAGRLALVLGVEVPTLGGWKSERALWDAAEDDVEKRNALLDELVQELWDLGVRHLFPVHGLNNAFGGGALFNRVYDAANFGVNDHCLKVETAPVDSGVQYRLDQDTFSGGDDSLMETITAITFYYGPEPLLNSLQALVGQAGSSAVLGVFGALFGMPWLGQIGAAGTLNTASAEFADLIASHPVPPPEASYMNVRGGHINKQGITAHGPRLLYELMRRGMVIDVDHMGHKTIEAVLAQCVANRYPVCSSHTEFRALKHGSTPALPVPATDDRETWVSKNWEFDRHVNAAAFGTANAKRLRSEIDKQPGHLKTIRSLGGVVAPILYVGDGERCTCADGPVSWADPWGVPPDCAGSSKSFAQALEYACWHMRGRRVAYGTDINGGAPMPSPRFGNAAAFGLSSLLDTQVHDHGGPAGRFRTNQVLAQTRGVTYAEGLTEYRAKRFSAKGSSPFDDEENGFWEALAARESGVAPAAIVTDRLYGTRNFVINLCAGLAATDRSNVPIAIDWSPVGGSAVAWSVGLGEDRDIQLVAYLAQRGEAPAATDSPRVKDTCQKLARVYRHWIEAHGPTGNDPYLRTMSGAPGAALYDSAGRMIKAKAGKIPGLGDRPRDFDVNVDGVAHIGLVPDFMQDLSNIQHGQNGVRALYRGAADYIRMWKLCEKRKAFVEPPADIE